MITVLNNIIVIMIFAIILAIFLKILLSPSQASVWGSVSAGGAEARDRGTIRQNGEGSSPVYRVSSSYALQPPTPHV